MQKDTYIASEIAAALNVTARSINLRAQAEKWPFLMRISRGGKVSAYLFTTLPQDVKSALTVTDPEDDTPESEAARRLSALSAVNALAVTLGQENARELIAERTGVSAVTLYNWQRSIEGKGSEAAQIAALIPQAATPAALPPEPLDTSRLKDWQRKVMLARSAILAAIERRAEEIGVNQAVKEAVSGQLSPETAALIPVANARSGKGDGSRTLTRSTIFRWRQDAAKGIVNLAPKDIEKAEAPIWAAAFLKHYRIGSKVSIPEAIENMKEAIPPGFPVPSEGQARRFLAKMSTVDQQKGRRTGSELKAIKGFTRRDDSGLWPLDVCLCDGHSFKARVIRPDSKGLFHPELCAVVDVATRRVIGWSAGHSESATTVGDALRHAVTVTPQKPCGGIPALFYTDGGSGNMAERVSDPVLGITARLGITHKTGIPGNPQGRGLVEKLNVGLWIALAKKLPTCTTKSMDKLTMRNCYLLTERDVKKTGGSELAPTWPQFLKLAQAAVDAYNARPHAGLPKITDPVTGRRRRMCPNEAWAFFVAMGFKSTAPEPHEMADLFRPSVIKTVSRCEVTDPAGNRFYAAELTPYHGRKVFVQYDIHDPSQVWVRDSSERLICVAKFEANKRHFFAVSVVEQARIDRENRRVKLKEDQIAGILAERAVTDVTPRPCTLTPEEETAVALMLEAPEQSEYYADDYERYAALLSKRGTGGLSEADAQWLSTYEAALFDDAASN